MSADDHSLDDMLVATAPAAREEDDTAAAGAMTPRSGDDEFHAAGIGQRPDEEPANEPDPESLSRSSFAKTMSKAAAAGPSLSSIKTVMMLSRKQRQAKRKVAQDELAKENQGMAVHKRAFQLLVLTLVPVIAFGVVFTEMGFGHECYRAIATQSSLAKPIQMVCLVTIVVLYVLDFGYWDSGSSKVVRTILIAAIAAAICLSTVLSFKSAPYLPITVFTMALPFYYWLTYHYVMPGIHVANYLKVLGPVLILTGLVCIGISVYWVAVNEFWWDRKTKDHFECVLEIGAVGDAACYTPENGSYAKAGVCGDNDEECLAGFVLWAGQFMMSSLVFLMGAMCAMISRSQTESVGDDTALSATNKIFLYLCLGGCAGIWVAAQIAATEMALAQVVMVFSGLLLCGTAAIMLFQIGVANVGTKLEQVPMVQKLQQMSQGVGVQALLILVGTPAILVVALVSFLNQLVRKSPIGWTKTLEGEERSYVFTKPVHEKFNAARKWQWSKILTRVVWFGLIYSSIQVGVLKYTNVVLSLMNEGLVEFTLWQVTIIFFFIGITMFLLPPIPGVPVYITGGIIVARAAEREWEGSFDNGTLVPIPPGKVGKNFGLAVLYTCFVCTLLKCMACACQQKLIGQNFKNSVAIRKAVGVNSISVRAIRCILMQPGLSYRKVMILCGGPDWPTSVLAGILGTNVWQMVLGTAPIFPVVSCCVIAGAFQTKASINAEWNALSGLALTLATVTGTLCLIMSGVEIEGYTNEHRHELEEEEPDKEVLAIEEKEARDKKVMNEKTVWALLPTHMQAVLVLAAMCMHVSVLVFLAMGSSCFEQFDVNTAFSGPPLYGNWAKLIKPFGWIIVAIHVASLLLLWVYKRWVRNNLDDWLEKPEGGSLGAMVEGGSTGPGSQGVAGAYKSGSLLMRASNESLADFVTVQAVLSGQKGTLELLSDVAGKEKLTIELKGQGKGENDGVQVLSADDARTTSLTEAERAACMSLPMPGKQEPVVLAAQDAAARSAWVEMLRTIASGQIEVRWYRCVHECQARLGESMSSQVLGMIKKGWKLQVTRHITVELTTRLEFIYCGDSGDMCTAFVSLQSGGDKGTLFFATCGPKTADEHNRPGSLERGESWDSAGASTISAP